MQRFKLCPIFNGISDYSGYLQFISEVAIFSSLQDGLPFGYIDFNDTKGDLLAAFDGFQVGASVDLKPISNDEEKEQGKEVNLIEDWVVLRVVTEDTQQTSHGACIVRVYIGHKMFLFKDQKNHCYEEQELDKLVSRILSDQTRGCSFSLAYTDKPDNGKHVRYKTNESDWEFLKNKIVSIASYKKTPIYLYSDFYNKFYFKSIASMYSTKPKVGLYVHPVDEKDKEAYNEWQNGADFNTFEEMVSFDFDIGEKRAVSDTVRQFSVYDTENSLAYHGIKEAIVKTADGSKLAKYKPFDMVFAHASAGGTTTTVIMNHSLDDSYNMLSSIQRYTDHVFNMSIRTRFCSPLCEIGSTVDIFISKGHWANGIWIIHNVTITSQQGGEVFTSVELARASFSGSKKDTTIKNIGIMYQC